MGLLCSLLQKKPGSVFIAAQREFSGEGKCRAAAIERVISGSGGGDGNKDEPKGSAGALCTPYWVPLDVTGDILCEGQKQTSQRKQVDVDKRRHTGLIIWEPREFFPQNATSISGRAVRPN